MALLISCESDKVVPVVVINYPISGTIVEDDVIIRVAATSINSVVKVEFLIDGVVMYVDETSPWEFSWNSNDFDDGDQHSVFAKGYDSFGNVGFSKNTIVTLIASNRKPVGNETLKRKETMGVGTLSILSQESANEAPTAFFSITPTSGSLKTVFNFDATGCKDKNENDSKLQVRWDWENDGTWDTDFSTSKNTKHQFLKARTYSVKMEVRNSGELTDTTSQNVFVSQYKSGGETRQYTYKTIQIGDQNWMAENLKETHFRDGSKIPNLRANIMWSGTNSSAYSEYGKNVKNVETLGLLYNWYAVTDGRNIAPEGWHVPSDKEWKILINHLGGDDVAGGTLKEEGTDHWIGPNSDANNSSSFSALPGGYRGHVNGYFSGVGYGSYFWSTTEQSGDKAFFRELHYRNSRIERFSFDKNYGFSVRCIKD
jgi:uncharacterized protein (TIGR02145 family)